MMNLAEQSAVYRCDKNKGAVCHTDQSAVYRCSVHTHSTLCDGRDSPEKMAAAAFAAGVQYYGFSGHSHTISPFDAGCVLPVRPEEYCRRVLALRQQYHGQMQILLGIELDSLSDMDFHDVPWRFDYWIGSVHHLVTEQGEDFCVDYSREVFARGVKEIFHGDMYALWKGYYAEVGAMAERNPPVLGHMDLVTKFNENGAFFDETDRGYRGLALGALHRCDVEKTLLEVNTGAMSRGYRREPYPAAFLLEEWRKMGGRVIVTADAHSAETILYGYGAAVELLQATGYTESAILTLEGVKMVAL